MSNHDDEVRSNGSGEGSNASDRGSDDGKNGGDDGESLFIRLGGETAIDAVVDAFYEANLKDPRVQQFFQNVADMQVLEAHQKAFLTVAFGGEADYKGRSLEEAHQDLSIEEEHFEAVCENLVTILNEVGVAQNLIEEVTTILGGVKPQIIQGQGKGASTTTVTYEMQNEHVEVVQKHLAWVVEAVGSVEEVGQVIYDNVFNNAGDAKFLFVSPKRVTAFRFISQVQRYVEGAGDVEYLDSELYNMSMRHIAYITPAWCKKMMPVFIGQIIGSIRTVLDEEWDKFGDESWNKFLGYLGGMLLRNLSEFSGKVHIIRRSWGVITKTDTGGKKSGGNVDTGEINENEEMMMTGGEGDKDHTSTSQVGMTNFGESLFFNVGVMSPEISAMFKRTKEELAPLFGQGFANLTVLISDPNLLNEELYILGIRHLKYGTRDEYFPVFGQAVMVTLRSMLPKDWNWAHEDAWGWLWDTCSKFLSRNIEEGHVNKQLVDDTMDKMVGADMVAVGVCVYTRLFELSDEVQNFFYKPNAMVTYIVKKVIWVLSTLCHEPIVIAHEVRSLGMRHIKYNIPPVHFPLFGKAILYALATFLEGFWTDDTEKSWFSLFEFVKNTMTRAVNEGSNLVTKSMVNNSVDEMEDTLKQAPRGVRDFWVLEVNVSGEIISPFYWALFDGKHEMSKYILGDLLTIRADRERYYFGAENLFITHPGVVKNLAVLAPHLLKDLFDGLMWRSRLTEGGKRRVNYYIQDLYGNPTNERYYDPYHTPLAELGRLHYSELYEHPVTQFIVSIKWERFARGMFIRSQAFFLTLLIIFIVGYNILTYTPEDDTFKEAARVVRIILFVINLGVLLGRQLPRMAQEVMRNQVVYMDFRVFRIPVPVSLTKPSNVSRLVLNFLLVILFIADDTLDVVDKTTAMDMRSFTAGFSSVILWILLLDWYSLDIRTAQFKLALGTVCIELVNPLVLLVYLLVGLGCACYLAKGGGYGGTYIAQEGQTAEEAAQSAELMQAQLEASGAIPMKHIGFDRADNSLITLFTTIVGNYVIDFTSLNTEQSFFFVVFLFLASLMLMSLFTAISTSITYLRFGDIEGLTFLERGKEIVELESMCTLESRIAIWDSLNFDKKIEFDEGDMGISQGIQVQEEAARILKVNVENDRIFRFPGEASEKLPWPSNKNEASTSDEKAIKLDHELQRINKMVRDVVKLSDMKGKGKKQAQGGATESIDRSSADNDASGMDTKSSDDA